MFNKIKTLFAVLIIIICGVANADYEDVEHGLEQGHAMQGMEMILNGNVYEIQQETSKMEFRVDSPIGDIWASFQDFEGHFLMFNNGRDHALARHEQEQISVHAASAVPGSHGAAVR